MDLREQLQAKFEEASVRQRALGALRLSFAFIRTAALCAAMAAVPAASAAQRGPRSPTRSPIASSGSFFTTMSEEGGSFPSENFVSNEKTYQYVIPTLQRTLTPGGVYLGVGPEQNFTYIANLKPRMAVIFDIRRQNAMAAPDVQGAVRAVADARGVRVAAVLATVAARRSRPSATPAELFAAVVDGDGERFGVRRELEGDRRSAHGHARLRAVGRRRRIDAARVRRLLRGGPGHQLRAIGLGAPLPSVTPWLVTYARAADAHERRRREHGVPRDRGELQRLRALERETSSCPWSATSPARRRSAAWASTSSSTTRVVTAFYTSNVEQYLFTSRSDERFYETSRRSRSTRPARSSARCRRVPGPQSSPIRDSSELSRPISAISSVQITDSGGVRVLIATGVDSGGKAVTRRIVDAVPPVTLANTTAFISGIATISRVLGAFANGQLKTYEQLNAMTKTGEWKSPP